MIKARYQKMYTEKHKQDMDFVIVGERYIGPFVDMDTAQEAAQAINSQFAPQPKPRTRTEYEKVTESIFDLRDEFKRGELYSKHKNKEKYYQINTEVWVVNAINNNNVYRKVEKEIDWRLLLRETIEKSSGRNIGDGSVMVGTSDLTDEEFLMLCHEISEVTNKPRRPSC